jgi:hypothetical protein
MLKSNNDIIEKYIRKLIDTNDYIFLFLSFRFISSISSTLLIFRALSIIGITKLYGYE